VSIFEVEEQTEARSQHEADGRQSLATCLFLDPEVRAHVPPICMPTIVGLQGEVITDHYNQFITRRNNYHK
jgi:hypothetical protein